MRAYRFLYDQSTGQYKGVTRDKSVIHATHEPPIFSYGHQTVWDFKGQWTLIENEIFYSQMADFGLIQIHDVVCISEVKASENRVSKALSDVFAEQSKAHHSVQFSIQESVKANRHHTKTLLTRQEVNYQSLVNILERVVEQSRELNYKVTVLQTSLENTFTAKLKNLLIKLWMWRYR